MTKKKGSLGSRRVQALIDLMADPTNAMTQAQMADALGLSPRTVRRWKRLPEFGDALCGRIVELMRADLHLVFKALMRESLRGNVPASKLLLDEVGRLKRGELNAPARRTLQEWVESIAALSTTTDGEEEGVDGGAGAERGAAGARTSSE